MVGWIQDPTQDGLQTGNTLLNFELHSELQSVAENYFEEPDGQKPVPGRAIPYCHAWHGGSKI